MCWESYKKEKRMVAPEKGVTVYKIMMENNNGDICTPFKGMKMIPNTLNIPISIRVCSNSDGYFIEEGYHSFDISREAMLMCPFMKGSEIWEALIPENTAYYINKRTHEVVSENIILKNIIYTTNPKQLTLKYI